MDSDMFSTVSSGLLTVVSASGGLGMGVSFSGSLEITVLSRVPSSLSGTEAIGLDSELLDSSVWTRLFFLNLQRSHLHQLIELR